MAGDAPSMQAMIDADRAKRKAEKIAAEVFGRKSAIPSQRGRRGGAQVGGSLASRVGVNKQRSSSATPKLGPSIDGNWLHDLHHVNNPQKAQKAQSRSFSTNVERKYALYSKLSRELGEEGIRGSLSLRGAASGPSMSIRGMASNGPWVVIASNFAPGTTAMDIQAAMEPVGGAVSSCHLITSKPTVMAELVFGDKDGAENVIATFNNQMADGRLLYVYMKAGGPTPHLHPLHQSVSTTAANPAPAPPRVRTPSPPIIPAPQAPLPRKEYITNNSDRDLMDIDDDPGPEAPRRPRADNEQRSGYQSSRPGYRGGYDRRVVGGGRSYGGSGLYSDNMVNGRSGGGGGYR